MLVPPTSSISSLAPLKRWRISLCITKWRDQAFYGAAIHLVTRSARLVLRDIASGSAWQCASPRPTGARTELLMGWTEVRLQDPLKGWSPRNSWLRQSHCRTGSGHFAVGSYGFGGSSERFLLESGAPRNCVCKDSSDPRSSHYVVPCASGDQKYWGSHGLQVAD